MKQKDSFFSILSILTISFLCFAFTPPPEKAFDRLDGKGPSGVRVDVISWEGNMELHVYPKESLKGLALKIDRRNKNKPVLVIGYRFQNRPNIQYIRRAILDIPLKTPFFVYQDPRTDVYDKIIISSHQLGSPLKLFSLDPTPTRLYPKDHPFLKQPPPLPTQRIPRTPARTPPTAPSYQRTTPVDDYGGVPYFNFK